MSKDDIGSMIRTATKNISGGQPLSQSEQAIVSNLAISMRESQRNWQPIFVRETGLYQFQLIGSSLILEAAKLAGLEVVYCIQVDESENTSQDIMNFQNTIQGTGGESGTDLSPLLRRIDQLEFTINEHSTSLKGVFKYLHRLMPDETLAINKSLSSLADVISALKEKRHVTYRNSKLTFVLQNSLSSPSSKTLMIVNLNPVSINESLCSLRFAAKVNSCSS